MNLSKYTNKLKKTTISLSKKVSIFSLKAWKKFLGYLPEKITKLNVFGAITASIFLFGFTLVVWALIIPLPSIENFHNSQLPQSTKIYDSTGKVLLYDLSQSMRRTEIGLDQISPDLKHATIAIEDENFYTHIGFNTTSIFRALLADLTSAKLSQGGSTITQQVVKNNLLSGNKSIIRKIKELVLAVRLEHSYSKDQILQTYLNESPYGGTIYGVEEASQNYFGVSAKDLTLAQAAYIASLPKGPTYYSPYGNHLSELGSRKNLVLRQMLEQHYITSDQYTKAKEEKVTFLAESNQGIKAPHFVFYIKQELVDMYGEEAVAKGGFKVTTTLNWEFQKNAEKMLTKKALENSVKLNATNAGLVAIDPKTGHVLAMVGSRGYFDDKIDGKVNIALAKRQPGSAFKPFVYATAFEKGYTPDTVIFDLKTQFSTSCAPDDFTTHDQCYSPSNFNEEIHGPMTMKNALAQSVNIASVKTLYLAGISDSIDTASSMGITTLTDKSRFGLALVLGGGEVTLLDMTSAYGVFANDGVRNPATGILKIEDPKGNLVYAYQASSTQVLNPQIARTITDILSDNVARTPEFGPRSPLYFPDVQIGVKTGTTNDFRDAWIVGYSNGIAIGVWAGNNDNTPMKPRIAEISAAPLWHQVMQYAVTIGGYQALAFEKPLPRQDTASLPPVLRGDWNSDPALGIHDILYWIDKNHPRVASAQTSVDDPQFSRWEYPVQLWAYQNDPTRPLDSASTSPDVMATTSTLVVAH